MGVIAMVFVVLVTTITAHELAHLLAARAVGHQVFEIQVGGGIVWSRRFGEVDVRVGPVPIGGHVQTGALDERGYRWRATVVALAGVGANLVLVMIGLVWIPALVAINVLAIVVNLWPGRRRMMGQPSSDGRAAFDLIRNDRDAIAEERSGWYSVSALRARDSGDLDTARQTIEDGIAEVGETRALLAVQGVIAFEQQRFVDVVHAYAPLIGDDRVTVRGRAGFAADAAWSALLSDDPALRRLAEPWAQLAVRVRPGDHHRRTALALARFEMGDLDGARSSLEGIDGPAAVAVAALVGRAAGDPDPAPVARAIDGLSVDHPLRRRLTEIAP